MLKKCPGCGTSNKKKFVVSKEGVSCSCGFINDPNYLKKKDDKKKTKKICKKNGKQKSGNHIKFNDKELSILKELLARREGMRVETINKITGIPSRTLYRKLNILSQTPFTGLWPPGISGI